MTTSYRVGKTLMLAMTFLLGTLFVAARLDAQRSPDGRSQNISPDERGRWEREAMAGDATAQAKLGAILISERRSKSDIQAGLAWIEKAAVQGNPLAERILGDVLSSDRLVRKDEPTAVSWYKRAAEGGDPDAQSELGVRYKLGWGVPTDDAESIKWERAAAANDDIPALMYLGRRYEDGRGVPQDFVQAVEYFKKAAQLGSAIGMCWVGDMYLRGAGVDKSASDAYQWYVAAFTATPPRRPIRPVDWGPLSEDMRKNCETSRKAARAQLTPSARVAAETAAQDWLARVTYQSIP